MTAKDLKNALLQEAVQGKLVPQIKSEGNARELLEEIRKERMSHGLDFANAKSGKKKGAKEAALADSNPCDIPEDEIPFDIPESWCWCRLGEIVDFGKCENAEPNEINPEDWILDLEDIEKDTGKILAFKTKSDVDSKSTKHIFKKGFVLYSKLRPYLNKCVIANKDGFCTSEILPLNFGDKIYNKYAQLYLMSPFFVEYTTSLSFGVKMPRLGTEDGKKALFPLPPLAEQYRIVAAIEQFMPLMEEYGKKEAELTELNAKISSLTKKAILQEAVQGKLVPQINSEGNARELLEEIRKERMSHGLDFANAKSGKKKGAKEAALADSNPCDIPEDEIPFDIPESWCWCRLGEIVYNNGQKTPDKEFSYIDIGSIDNEHQKLNEKENFIQPDKAPSRARKIVKKGDVIYSTVRPYLHNMCIIDKEFQKEPIASTGFAVMTSSCGLNNKYLFYYLLSPTFDNYANATDNAKGVAYPAINDDKLYKGLVPLPPLAEQKRIVEAIEKLLPLCERLGG